MLQADTRADIYERHRRELVNYATRLVVRESVAEELTQEAALRLLQDQRLPNDEGQIGSPGSEPTATGRLQLRTHSAPPGLALRQHLM